MGDAVDFRNPSPRGAAERRRVVIITEIISPYRIPVFNALADLEQVDLHVVFLAETDSTQRHWLVYKEEIRFSYEVLRSFRRRIAGNNFLLNWGMSAALRRASPELIICGGYNYLASWQALRWAGRANVPFFLWSESNERDSRSGSRLTETLKQAFVRRCGGFIVPGNSSREYLLKYGVSPQNIFVAPNAVDNDGFAAGADVARAGQAEKRRTLDLPSRYFLFVGRLVPEKGIFDLLEAYGALDSKIRAEVGLVIVGNGPAQGAITDLQSRIFPGKTKVAGFAQRDELAAYYGLAELFVFPTHSDPWGLVVNEAMACGLPVVATDVAGCVGDLVKEGRNGLLTKVGDSPALASAMARIAGDPELQQKMAAASREIISAYSPEAWARGVAQTLPSGLREKHAD